MADVLHSAQTISDGLHDSKAPLIDTNGNLLIAGAAISSAVNYLQVANASGSNSPSISAIGSAINLDLLLNSKGTGVVKFNNVEAVDVSSSQTLSGKSLSSPTIIGTIVFTDDVRQTFNPGTTVSGFNVGSVTADPSAPINGDIWYQSTAEELRARINGATVALNTGGGGGGIDYPSPTDNTVPIYDSGSGDLVDSRISDNGSIITLNGGTSLGVGGSYNGLSLIFDVSGGTSDHEIFSNASQLSFRIGGSVDNSIILTNSEVSIISPTTISGLTATDIPLQIELATSQTANAFEVNTNGGSGGDLFHIDGSGVLVSNGLNYPTTDGTNGQAITTDGSGNLTFTTISGGGGASSPLVLTSNTATELPLEIELASGQTENAFEVNSNAGSGGDLFHIKNDGHTSIGSGAPTTLGILGVADHLQIATNKIIYFGTSATSYIGGTQGSSGGFVFGVGGQQGLAMQRNSQCLILGNAYTFAFSSTATVNLGSSADVALARYGANVLHLSDGSTGNGSLLTSRRVVALTSNTTLVVDESNTLYTNEGAGATTSHSLPTAVAGLTYSFYVQEAQDLTVNAASGDTIRINGTESAAAGDITSSTVGSAVRITAVNATEWVAETVTGTWTVT